VRNLVRNRQLAKSISDASWARFRQWVEYDGPVQGIPVVAVPARTIRAKRVRVVGGRSTSVCRCVPLSVRGAAWSWTETTTRRAPSWRARSSSERAVVPWGTRDPKRLVPPAGLLLPTARWSVAPAGGTKNLPHACGQSVK
jgi:hypothetical protein